MKKKDILFLAVAFFIGYFANTIINMNCMGNRVVEGAGKALPKCRGRWLAADHNGDHSRFSEYKFKAGACPPADSEYWGSWDHCLNGDKKCKIPVEGATWDDQNNQAIQCARAPNEHSQLEYDTQPCK